MANRILSVLVAIAASFIAPAAYAQACPSPDLTLADYGGDPTGIADSGPAFQDALDACPIVHVGSGTFRIGSAVTMNYSAEGGHVEILGAGDSELLLDAAQPLHFDDTAHIVFRDLVFIGSPTVGEANCTTCIAIHGSKDAVFERTLFYGLGARRGGSWGAVVSSFNSVLTIRDSAFFGCFADDAVVLATQVRDGGVTLDHVKFLDPGTLHGVNYSKSGGASGPWFKSRQWQNQGESADIQGTISLAHCLFDEAPGKGIVVGEAYPGEGPGDEQWMRTSRVVLDDCAFNVGNDSGNFAARFENVEHVTVRGGWSGWTNGSNAAIDLRDVGTARISEMRAKAVGANIVVADEATRYLLVEDSPSLIVDSDATTTVVMVDGVEQ